MCEFNVKVKEHDGEKEVANDIVYVKLDGEGVTLKDITSKPTKVESAIVSYVNVTSEELHLVKHPLIGAFLKLLSELSSSSNLEDAQASWKAFVKEGERLLSATKHHS
ncbi:MAG: CooT family nickel-binding protein [Candidatus Freyarchaeota archaeon]|nr:CooT family nickel-binding protein [Candidatus Jordarchaeia archaeon]